MKKTRNFNRTIKIAYGRESEQLLGTPTAISATSEQAGYDQTDTVVAEDLATVKGTEGVGYSQGIMIMAMCDANPNTGSAWLYTRFYLNDVLCGTTVSSNTNANYYYLARAVITGVKVGDVIGVKMWRGTATLDIPYAGLRTASCIGAIGRMDKEILIEYLTTSVWSLLNNSTFTRTVSKLATVSATAPTVPNQWGISQGGGIPAFTYGSWDYNATLTYYCWGFYKPKTHIVFGFNQGGARGADVSGTNNSSRPMYCPTKFYLRGKIFG